MPFSVPCPPFVQPAVLRNCNISVKNGVCISESRNHVQERYDIDRRQGAVLEISAAINIRSRMGETAGVYVNMCEDRVGTLPVL